MSDIKSDTKQKSAFDAVALAGKKTLPHKVKNKNQPYIAKPKAVITPPVLSVTPTEKKSDAESQKTVSDIIAQADKIALQMNNLQKIVQTPDKNNDIDIKKESAPEQSDVKLSQNIAVTPKSDIKPSQNIAAAPNNIPVEHIIVETKHVLNAKKDTSDSYDKTKNLDENMVMPTHIFMGWVQKIHDKTMNITHEITDAHGQNLTHITDIKNKSCDAMTEISTNYMNMTTKSLSCHSIYDLMTYNSECLSKIQKTYSEIFTIMGKTSYNMWRDNISVLFIRK